MDNDMISMFKKAMEGVVINEETLGVDEIKEIGASGDFIGQMSTINNMGIQSCPKVFSRDMLGDWRAKGSKSAVEVAHEIVVDVMKNYKVLPIAEDRIEAMSKIVKKADAEFKKEQAEKVKE